MIYGLATHTHCKNTDTSECLCPSQWFQKPVSICPWSVFRYNILLHGVIDRFLFQIHNNLCECVPQQQQQQKKNTRKSKIWKWQAIIWQEIIKSNPFFWGRISHKVIDSDYKRNYYHEWSKHFQSHASLTRSFRLNTKYRQETGDSENHRVRSHTSHSSHCFFQCRLYKYN